MAVMYFEASVELYNRNGKERLKGKFLAIGHNYTSVKNFISNRLEKKYPDYIQKIRMLPMKSIDGVFIETLGGNESKDSESSLEKQEN